MIEYYQREHYDGTYSVSQVRKRKIGNWLTRRWIDDHEKIIVTGVTYEEAQAAMKDCIAVEKGNAVKSITTYTSSGDLHPDHYPF